MLQSCGLFQYFFLTNSNEFVSYQSFAIGLTNTEQNVMTTVLLTRRSRKLNFFSPHSLGACCVTGLWERGVAVLGRWEGLLPCPSPRAGHAVCCELAGTDCLLHSQLTQGSPAGEGGAECSPVRCWRGAAAEGSFLWALQGEGGALKGMTAPVLSVSQSSVSLKRLF